MAQYINSQCTLKIALIGPCLSGKTKFSNQLSHNHLLIEKSLQRHVSPSPSPSSSSPSPYDPTVGVRILTFTSPLTAYSPTSSLTALLTANIELWDCGGGDRDEEVSRPIVSDGLDGVLVFFDPLSRDQAIQLKVYCESYVRGSGLREGQIAVIAHYFGPEGEGESHKKTVHKPLVVQGSDGANVSIPIIPICTTFQEGDVGDVEQFPSTKEFIRFAGGVFGITRANELETLAQ